MYKETEFISAKQYFIFLFFTYPCKKRKYMSMYAKEGRLYKLEINVGDMHVHASDLTKGKDLTVGTVTSATC